MTIKYVIEGPKGVGKSTLAQMLRDKGKVDLSTHFSGEWDKLLTNDVLESNHQSKLYHVHDRGYLSNFIYSFVTPLSSIFSPYQESYNGTMGQLTFHRPVTLADFDDYMSKVERLVVLYVSDVKLLQDRLNERLDNKNKGYTTNEWETLSVTNDLFKGMLPFLRHRYGHKVIAINVSDYDSIESVYDMILAYE